MPVGAMQSYEIKAPPGHWRPASCAEVDCPAWRLGWRTVLDERLADHAPKAHYIRTASGRGFAEHRDESGLTVFEFEAGQTCFSASDDAHRVQSRPSLYLVRGGDWRGSTGLMRRHTSPESWVSDFGEHQDKLLAKIERG